MNLSKSRKVMLGLLGLAVVAFAADKLLRGGDTLQPNAAAAQGLPGGTLPALQPALTDRPAATDEAKAAPALSSVAERLKGLAETSGLNPDLARDAFLPPDSWIAQPPAPAPATVVAVDPAADFAGKHKVTAVILVGNAGSAIIDGKVMQIGQELGGFALVRMAAGSVVFKAISGSSEVELRLARAPPPARRAPLPAARSP
jgi:hypothetical protein